VDYSQLIEDCRKGLINPKKFRLVVCDLESYWECIDETISKKDWGKIKATLEKKYGVCNGTQDFMGLLKAAGVPAARRDRTYNLVEE